MSTTDINTLLKEKSRDFKLELLSGSGGLGKKITVPDKQTGSCAYQILEHFPYERVRIL
jgi:hypothetical protein